MILSDKPVKSILYLKIQNGEKWRIMNPNGEKWRIMNPNWRIWIFKNIIQKMLIIHIVSNSVEMSYRVLVNYAPIFYDN